MQEELYDEKTYPCEKASLLSKIFFCWAPPLFFKRYKAKSEENKIYNPLKSHESGNLGDNLENVWNSSKSRNESPSLWYCLWKTFGGKFVMLGAAFIFSEFAFKMTQPWLIGQLVKRITTGPNKENYFYGSLIILTSFLGVVINHSNLVGIQHLGMKARIASSSLIYRKILRMDVTAVSEHTTGKIINLLANDVNRFDFAPMYLLQLMVAPVETVLILCCLYSSVGLTAISGIVFLIIFIPIQLCMGKLTSNYRSKTAIKTDKRVGLLNEIISGIQVIKMFTWEKPFRPIVQEARKSEVRQIKNVSYLKALNVSFMLIINRTGIFLSIATQFLLYRDITAEYVFVLSAFYAILRQTLTVYIPYGMSNFAETRIAVERIRQFLLCSEILRTEEQHVRTYYDVNRDGRLIEDKSKVHFETSNNKVSEYAILFKDVSAKWKSSSEYVLRNINFSVPLNQLVAITGAVGSGKSSLLNSILKECSLMEGSVEVNGTISYGSQVPWLMTGSIRQNILFGSKFDKEKYDKVVDICDLVEDFTTFPSNDNSLVGERGVLLSGGQKSRISLARAVYKEADIYLLDDPLSALDSQVGRKVFEKCIMEYLNKKCVILVTHNVQCLKSVDKVYVVANGNLEVKAEDNQLSIIENIQDSESTKRNTERISSKGNNQETGKEQSKIGAVPSSVYRQYAAAGGNAFMASFLCLLFVMSQTAASGVDYFLAFWVNRREIENNETFFNMQNCFYVYLGAIAFMIIATFLRSVTFFRFCVEASTNLHDQMFFNIIKAPMIFFNATPSGTILNRLSKDMGLVDEILPITMMETLQIAFICIGSFIILTALNMWMVIPTVFIMILFYYCRKVFLVSSRNLKRLEAKNKSPVFSHVTETIQGLTTIRSFDNQNLLRNDFEQKQNIHSSAFYMFLNCNRAFGFWIDLNCVFYMVIAVVSIILLDTKSGNIGLAITQSINLLGICQWGLRQWSEWENQMTSVERIVEYTEIKTEDHFEDNQITLSKEWPEEGKIQFDSVSLKYTKLATANLENVSFIIESGAKIGIVGRTGAGKTSLISTLFRLYQFEGVIKIDEVNIKTITLESLRSKISIIPQEPVLFSGNLRKNLDPFDEYDDSVLWHALDEVELKNAVSELPSGLESKVSEGGSNLSVGQRQLLCLARAVVRSNKILVLDEATASVDPQMDELIQDTIRKKFRNCTVLTIAHRLHTVMDSDKILVMESGHVAQFDHPHKLLQDTDGIFYGLVKQTGTPMAENLIKVAKQSFNVLNNSAM